MWRGLLSSFVSCPSTNRVWKILSTISKRTPWSPPPPICLSLRAWASWRMSPLIPHISLSSNLALQGLDLCLKFLQFIILGASSWRHLLFSPSLPRGYQVSFTTSMWLGGRSHFSPRFYIHPSFPKPWAYVTFSLTMVWIYLSLPLVTFQMSSLD